MIEFSTNWPDAWLSIFDVQHCTFQLEHESHRDHEDAQVIRDVQASVAGADGNRKLRQPLKADERLSNYDDTIPPTFKGDALRRSEGRFLTTHVGSLIRPSHLVELARQVAGGQGDLAAYEAELSADVKDVVESQCDAGLDMVNDGEFGKSSWAALHSRTSQRFRDPSRAAEAALFGSGRDRERFKGFFAASDMANGAVNGAPTEACIGPIAYAPIVIPSIAYGQSSRRPPTQPKPRMGRLEIFFTSVAPGEAPLIQGVNEYYKSEEEYIFAIADALRGRSIGQSSTRAPSCRSMMPVLCETCTTTWSNRGEESQQEVGSVDGSTRSTMLSKASQHVTECATTSATDPGMSRTSQMRYSTAIVDYMLQVNAQAYSIEAANPRHEHEWQLWEDTKLPDDKILIPGIITHHTTTVEHPELVAQRIERFAKILGPERVIAGTDCGFAQGP